MKILDFRDRRFWKLMISIGLPIAIQNLIFNGLNLVDNILIGGLGEANIAAVGIANKLSFVFMLFMFGINSGANIFSAQFWGRKDLKGVRKVLGLSLMIGMTVAVPFTLLGTIFPHVVIDVFTDDPEVIRQGVSYLRIVALAYPINAVTAAYGIQSRGVGRTKSPLFASATALFFNTGFSYLLIYGIWGLPRMGVAGAAFATVLARVLECAILVGTIYRKKYELAAKFSEFTGYNAQFMKRFVSRVSPVMINEVLWALGVTGYMVFYGKLGTDAQATVQILDVINSMFFALFMGMGNACGAIIGNMIGAGEEDTARLYAKRSIMFGVIFGAAIGLLFFATAPIFLGFFKISESTLAICKATVIVYAAYTIPKVTNTIMIVGVCRGGGDTVFSMIIDVGAPWLIGLPMAFLGVYIFAFPVYLVIAMINLEELVKSILGVIRLVSNKWLHNLVHDIRHEEELAV
jgi:putative MATE family efflux protein